jgi:hypothetical protein
LATTEELRLQIKAEVADAVGKLKQYERQTKATADQNTSLSKTFAAMRDVMQGPIAAGKMVAGELSKIAKFAGELYDAWGVAEQAGIVFNQAIKDSGTISAAGGQRLKAYASELQKVSIYGDEGTVAIMGNLAAMGKSEDQIKELISAAADYASATGIDLDTAVKQLNSTLQGNVGVLGRQNSAVKALTTEQLKNGDAIKVIAEQYKGMAEAVGGSAAGGKISLTNAFGDLKEEMGSMVADTIKPVQNAMTEMFSKMASDMANARNSMAALGGGSDVDYASAKQSIRDQISNLENMGHVIRNNVDYTQLAIDAKKKELQIVINNEKAENARTRARQESNMRTSDAATATAEASTQAELATLAIIENSRALLENNEAMKIEFALAKQLAGGLTELATEAFGGLNTELANMYDLTEGEKSPFVGMTEDMRMAIEAIDPLIGKVTELTAAQEAMRSAAISGYTSMAEALGSALMTGEDGWKAFGKAGLNAIAGVVEAMAHEAEIIAGIAMAKALGGNFAALAEAGAALGQVAAAYAAAGAIRAIPLAEGGIVMPTPGGTLARIGEAGKPEAVIPLDKMGGMGGGVTQIFNIGGSVIAERQVKSLAMSGLAQASRGY